LFGQFLWLNAVDRFHDHRIEILNPDRRPVESDLAQGNNMIAGQPTWIHLDPSLDLVREGKVAVDDLAQLPDFIGREKGWRASTPMKLHHFAAGVEQSSHLGHFLLQVSDVSLPLGVVQGDDSGATTVPAQGFAKRNVEVQGEITLGAVILLDQPFEVAPLK